MPCFLLFLFSFILNRTTVACFCGRPPHHVNKVVIILLFFFVVIAEVCLFHARVFVSSREFLRFGSFVAHWEWNGMEWKVSKKTQQRSQFLGFKKFKKKSSFSFNLKK